MSASLEVRLCLLFILGVAAFVDRKTHLVPWNLLGIYFFCGVVTWLLLREISLLSVLAGMAVGAALLGLSFLSRGAVGSGDALLFMVTGMFLGFLPNVLLLLLSSLFAGLTSLVLIAVKKNCKKKQIAFVPFMLAGYVAMLAFY